MNQKPKDHGNASVFTRSARWAATAAGRPITFVLAVAIILVWAITGPLFLFSDTWQLVINTGTTIVTFLMVFLIQNTQNRDTEALQIKLDEIIRCTRGARNVMLDLEEMDEKELHEIRKEYLAIAEHARKHLEARSKK
jgi:low affinity Fe/Cu permease